MFSDDTVGSRHIPLLYVFINHCSVNLTVIASSYPGISGKMTVRKVKEQSCARSVERGGQLVGCLCQPVSIETWDQSPTQTAMRKCGGAPLYWNNMSLRSTSSKIRLRNSSKISKHSDSGKTKKGTNTFCVDVIWQQFKKTAWPLQTGPISWPETSVTKHKTVLRNIPEERRLHLHRGGSLKSLPASSLFLTSSISCLRLLPLFLAPFIFPSVTNSVLKQIELCDTHIRALIVRIL
jgi:hypothetical protein